MKKGLKILSFILFLGECISALGTIYQPIADAWDRHKTRNPDPIEPVEEKNENVEFVKAEIVEEGRIK